MNKHALDRNAGIWVEHGDRLFVAVYSSVASLVVRFSGYFRTAAGEIQQYAYDVAPTSDRAVTSRSEHFSAGFILSCVATLVTGNAKRGQCYVRADIQRSTGGPILKLHNVLGGYVTDDYSPSFPYGKIEGPLDGPGMLRNITGSDPAAGVEISETVPTGARWLWRAIYLTLVTGATVDNRYIRVRVDDGTNIYYETEGTDVQTASTTISYPIAPTPYTHGSHGTIKRIAWAPDVRSLAGHRLTTFTVTLYGTDNYGAPRLQVEEWLEA